MGLSSCFFFETPLPQSYSHYVLNMCLDKPYSTAQEKLKPARDISGHPASSSNDGLVTWSYVHMGQEVRAYYKQGKMHEWWITFNQRPPQSTLITSQALASDKLLLELLFMHKKGRLSKIRELYAKHSALDNASTHYLACSLAIKEDEVDVVRYYLSEKEISPDKMTMLWITVKTPYAKEEKHRLSKLSLRKFAQYYNAKQVLNYLN